MIVRIQELFPSQINFKPYWNSFWW